MEENYYGIIYCMENTINNNKYIGQTIRSLEERISEHFNSYNYEYNKGRALYQAINKYGKENFISYEIDSADCQEKLDEKETYWINHYNTFLGKGYNMTAGGQSEKKDHSNEDISNKLSEMFGGREFLIYDMEGNFIKSTTSQTAFAKELGCAVQSINNCLKGIKSQVKNHILIFKDEFSEERLKEIITRANKLRREIGVFDYYTNNCIGIWNSLITCSKGIDYGYRSIEKQLKDGYQSKRKVRYLIFYIDNCPEYLYEKINNYKEVI